MSKNTLTAFTWQRHRDAVTAIRKALMDTDRDMKALDRRSDLFPAERTARKAERHAKGMEAVRAARAGLSEKRWVVWPDTPGRPGEEGRVS